MDTQKQSPIETSKPVYCNVRSLGTFCMMPIKEASCAFVAPFKTKPYSLKTKANRSIHLAILKTSYVYLITIQRWYCFQEGQNFSKCCRGNLYCKFLSTSNLKCVYHCLKGKEFITSTWIKKKWKSLSNQLIPDNSHNH